jgi:hypothetical protein
MRTRINKSNNMIAQLQDQLKNVEENIMLSPHKLWESVDDLDIICIW